MPFVVDNSVVAGWHFASQATAYSDVVLDRMAGDTGHVPGLWRLEFSNILRKAVRAKRIAAEDAFSMLAFQDSLGLVVHEFPEEVAGNLRLSLLTGLSSYDAAYLGLAISLGLPLATLDGAMRDAAATVGVPLLS